MNRMQEVIILAKTGNVDVVRGYIKSIGWGLNSDTYNVINSIGYSAISERNLPMLKVAVKMGYTIDPIDLSPCLNMRLPDYMLKYMREVYYNK